MSKKMKWILICSITAAVLVTAALVGIFGFWLPYDRAQCSFTGDKTVIMQLQPDGAVELTWPLAQGADQYLVEVIDPQSGETEFSQYVAGRTSLTLPELAQGKRTIRIFCGSEYKFLFSAKPKLRLGEEPIEFTDIFWQPVITQVESTPYPDTDQLEVKLQLAGQCTVRLYKLEEGIQPTPVNSFNQHNLLLSFGDGQQWPLPAYGETYRFAFDAYREGEGYIFYGPMSQSVELTREELLGTVLILQKQDNGNNTFTLSWNETKGDYYEFQYRSTSKQKWNTLRKVAPQEERSYTTAAMKPYTSCEYRVVSRDAENAIVSESDAVVTEMLAAVAYSTIWPIKDLEVYTDILQTQSIGTAEQGKAFCVLKVEGSMFKIRLGNDFGYIDSNYCLINLPECMGELCAYDITNSYASLFKIHEYPIPELTDTVIPGYENVLLGDKKNIREDEEKQFLVPLLYPVVAKLEKAAMAAKKQGYTLKIVDAYRPQKATQVMYSTVVDYAENNMVPPEGPPGLVDPEAPTVPTLPTDPTAPTEPYKPITFAQFMTKNGKYKMNYFVAKGTSRHNRGAALDLTMIDEAGEVLMQTSIHDLSWYSETAENNAAAKQLAKIMKNAGFGGLVSEWWHFQDDEALDTLDLPAMAVGVTPECWMADEEGWRYRKADGSYYKNTTREIDGVTYQFDRNGYATQQEG